MEQPAEVLLWLMLTRAYIMGACVMAAAVTHAQLKMTSYGLNLILCNNIFPRVFPIYEPIYEPAETALSSDWYTNNFKVVVYVKHF